MELYGINAIFANAAPVSRLCKWTVIFSLDFRWNLRGSNSPRVFISDQEKCTVGVISQIYACDLRSSDGGASIPLSFEAMAAASLLGDGRLLVRHGGNGHLPSAFRRPLADGYHRRHPVVNGLDFLVLLCGEALCGEERVMGMKNFAAFDELRPKLEKQYENVIYSQENCWSEEQLRTAWETHKSQNPLAYITVHQQDSVGLALFDSRCRALLPAKSGPEHLRTICNTLVGHKPTDQTDLAVTLHSLAEQSRRRGLVVIFSDLFDDIEKIRPALSHFRRKKHDVIVYQILDRREIDFAFHDATAFVDLETGERIVTNPKDVRASYQQAIEQFLGQCREACAGLGVEHVLALTDQPPVDIIILHFSGECA